jgi:hypothetical protein
MPNYVFRNKDSLIRCYDTDGDTYEHWFMKKDIVSITTIGEDVLKIVVKNKPPYYFKHASIESPAEINAQSLANTLKNWLTQGLCHGNY